MLETEVYIVLIN